MPELHKASLERYAQLIAQGTRTMLDAFVESRGGNKLSTRTGLEISPKSLNALAYQTARRPDVKARVSELRGEITKHLAIDASKIQKRVIKEIELTAKSLIEKFENTYQAAMKEKQYGAATAALTAEAKVAGLWIERSEATNAHYAISDKPLTIEEFDAKYLTKH